MKPQGDAGGNVPGSPNNDKHSVCLFYTSIELQGTGEGRAFTLNEQQELVRLCAKGNRELLKIQKEALGGKL